MSTLPSFAQTNLQLYKQLIHLGWGNAELGRIAKGYNIALQLFGNRVRGNGKPFVCHLIGTASILAHCNQPVQVVLAGLLHAAYSQGNFGDQSTGATSERRQVLAALVAPKVEYLITKYAQFNWNEDTVQWMLSSSGTLSTVAKICAIMRLANHVEDYLDFGMAIHKKREKFSSHPSADHPLVQLSEKVKQPLLGDLLLAVFSEHQAQQIPARLKRHVGGSADLSPEVWWEKARAELKAMDTAPEVLGA